MERSLLQHRQLFVRPESGSRADGVRPLSSTSWGDLVRSRPPGFRGSARLPEESGARPPLKFEIYHQSQKSDWYALILDGDGTFEPGLTTIQSEDRPGASPPPPPIAVPENLGLSNDLVVDAPTRHLQAAADLHHTYGGTAKSAAHLVGHEARRRLSQELCGDAESGARHGWEAPMISAWGLLSTRSHHRLIEVLRGGGF